MKYSDLHDCACPKGIPMTY